MQFDLGPTGIGLLIAMSLAFGLVAQLVLGSGTRWMWAIAAAAWFVGGLLFSEAVFAGDDVQPIIDGLSFDEALLGGIVVGVPVAIATWFVTRRRHHHGPTPA
jgi:uncharacterized membrane protein YhhN